jgi:hypothetical protein
MDEHIPEPPSTALVSAPASPPVPEIGGAAANARLSMRDVRQLVYKALDELDYLGDRIANAVGIR